MQEIVDQVSTAIRCTPISSHLWANVSGADQNARQCHGQDLVRHTINIAQRLNQRGACRLRFATTALPGNSTCRRFAVKLTPVRIPLPASRIS